MISQSTGGGNSFSARYIFDLEIRLFNSFLTESHVIIMLILTNSIVENYEPILYSHQFFFFLHELHMNSVITFSSFFPLSIACGSGPATGPVRLTSRSRFRLYSSSTQSNRRRNGGDEETRTGWTRLLVFTTCLIDAVTDERSALKESAPGS